MYLLFQMQINIYGNITTWRTRSSQIAGSLKNIEQFKWYEQKMTQKDVQKFMNMD